MAKTSFSVPKAADLLRWYRRNGRDLPWRSHGGKAPSPYHTWLSEIMLQQTTVATVIPYYLKFIDKWPDITSLAAADDEQVMHAWAGLGYYSRARNLLKCARQVVAEHNATFPAGLEQLKKLPGIGEYTANAIRAIAFDLPANVVDGNVERVVSRVFAFENPINIPKSKATLRELAGQMAPDKHPGDYAQALMDLGATICTPRNPQCSECPWRNNCQAFATGKTDRIPKIERRKKLPEKFAACFILHDRKGRFLLRQRPATGLLGGLWEFPSTIWDNTLTLDQKDWPLPEKGFVKLPKPYVHTFTHFKLTTEIYVATKPVAPSSLTTTGTWCALDQMPPLSTLTKRILVLGSKMLGGDK